MCFISAGEKDAVALYSSCAGQRTKKSDLERLPPAGNLMQKLDKRQATHETRLRMLTRLPQDR
jgi:hypothetical protein